MRAAAERITLKRTDPLAGLQRESTIYARRQCSAIRTEKSVLVARNIPVTLFALKVAHVPEANHFPRLMMQPRWLPKFETRRLPIPWKGMPVLVGSDGPVVVREGSRLGVLGI